MVKFDDRIASIVLRLGGTLALILGILFWSGTSLNLIPIHYAAGSSGGALALDCWHRARRSLAVGVGRWRAARSLLACLLIVVGMTQSSLLIGPFHWVIQVVHLLLGVLAGKSVGNGSLQHGWRNSSAIREEQPSRAA